jgi:hypothetical protein
MGPRPVHCDARISLAVEPTIEAMVMRDDRAGIEQFVPDRATKPRSGAAGDS